MKGEWTDPRKCPRCGRKLTWFEINVGEYRDRSPVYSYDQADCSCGLRLVLEVPMPEREDER